MEWEREKESERDGEIREGKNEKERVKYKLIKCA